MASLKVKDGAGYEKNLQVSSGSDGFIPNHSIVSTVKNANVVKYYAGGPSGWDWTVADGSVVVADQDNNRIGLVINNDTADYEYGKCYIILGDNSFGVSNVSQPPPLYSIALEAGGIYIADTSTAALKHSIYVASSSYIANSSSMSVLVTKIT